MGIAHYLCWQSNIFVEYGYECIVVYLREAVLGINVTVQYLWWQSKSLGRDPPRPNENLLEANPLKSRLSLGWHYVS